MSRTAFGLITSRLSRAISSCSCLSLISLTASSLDLRVNSVFYMIHLGSIGVFGTGSPILGTGPAVSKIASAPRRNLTRNYSSQSARSSRLEMPTSPRCRGVSLEMLITPRDFSKALKSRKDAAKPENENVRTTVHTPPYTAVRQIVRTPVPAGGAAAGVWNRASTRKLRSLRRRAVGLHLPGWRAGRKIPVFCRMAPSRCTYLLSASTVQAFGESLRLLCPLLTSALRSERLTAPSVALPGHSADLPR
jgi:hypothetical protein